MPVSWDPEVYLRHEDARARPFHDLLARVHAVAPRRVADLGCGPGTLTRVLADRWPTAAVVGLDSSAAMIERAAEYAEPGRCEFALGDVCDWRPVEPVDVIVSNATLQWVPDHLALLASWVEALAPSGWMALQVPANFDARSHALMREVAATPRWRDSLAGTLRHGDAVVEPERYVDVLARAGCAVDAWQTTYLHLLPGEDAVLGWIRGTGLRPVLDALAPDDANEFVAAYGALLREAYPQQPYGTVFPFRRTFVVAQRPGEPSAAGRR